MTTTKKPARGWTTFTIDTDKNITAFDAAARVPEGQDGFTTEKEFAKLSADWPINRFAEVWNAFAGAPPFGDLKPVKKFTDRKTAVTRIWKAIQALTPAPRPRRPHRAEESQGGQGRHRQGRDAHGARRQQEGHRPRHAQAPRRRHTRRHNVRDRMAGAQRTRVHQWQPGQENGPQDRECQARRWTARLQTRAVAILHPLPPRRRRYPSAALPFLGWRRANAARADD